MPYHASMHVREISELLVKADSKLMKFQGRCAKLLSGWPLISLIGSVMVLGVELTRLLAVL